MITYFFMESDPENHLFYDEIGWYIQAGFTWIILANELIMTVICTVIIIRIRKFFNNSTESLIEMSAEDQSDPEKS